MPALASGMPPASSHGNICCSGDCEFSTTCTGTGGAAEALLLPSGSASIPASGLGASALPTSAFTVSSVLVAPANIPGFRMLSPKLRNFSVMLV